MSRDVVQPGDLKAYLGSIAAESSARVDRVRHLIGDRHWLSAGEWHESIVRGLLRAHLPERFEVSTGFVRWHDTIVSKQLDVLIWDRLQSAPYLRDGEFVIVPPDGVVAVLEVKTTLTRRELLKSLQLLHHNAWRSYQDKLHVPGAEAKRPIRGIVAFRAAKGLRSSARIFDALAEFYRAHFKGSRAAMGTRLGVVKVNAQEDDFGRWAEFFRPRFVNLIDAVTIADGVHIEQAKVWGGPGQVDPAYVALEGCAAGHHLALSRLVLLIRDLANRRVEQPGHTGSALRRDMVEPFAQPALGTFGGAVDAGRLRLTPQQVWRPDPPLW